MAKKFSKFLMFTALAGAAAVGAYYYLQNKNTSYEDDMDDDDFDDFSDEPDDDTDGNDTTRNYVALNPDKAEDAVKDAVHTASDLTADAAKTVMEAAKDIAETTESKIEEFFDDDDEDNSADSI